jgi:hypothetical protein
MVSFILPLHGQYLPKDGAKLNYNQIYFEYPYHPQASNYKLYLATDSVSSKINFKTYIDNTPATRVSGLEFGQNYKWYVETTLKSGEKNYAENQKKIEDAINKASDDIASQALGRYLSAFQQMGEGMLETTIRLSAQAAVASGGMEKLGIKTNLTGLGLITFSDSLTRAFGGLKEFKAGIDSLYEAFTSDPQKLIDSKKQVADFLTTLNAPASAGLPAEITSKADAAKVKDYLLKLLAKN